MSRLTSLFGHNEIRETDETGAQIIKINVDDTIPYTKVTVENLTEIAGELNIKVPKGATKKKLYSLVFNEEVE